MTKSRFKKYVKDFNPYCGTATYTDESRGISEEFNVVSPAGVKNWGLNTKVMETMQQLQPFIELFEDEDLVEAEGEEKDEEAKILSLSKEERSEILKQQNTRVLEIWKGLQNDLGEDYFWDEVLTHLMDMNEEEVSDLKLMVEIPSLLTFFVDGASTFLNRANQSDKAAAEANTEAGNALNGGGGEVTQEE